MDQRPRADPHRGVRGRRRGLHAGDRVRAGGGRRVAAGLALLGDEVRAAVADRLARCRRTGEPFTGVVAGVLVTVDAHAGTPHPGTGSFRTGFDATIGEPLVTLPSS
jgi:hypothetical protein